MWIFELGYALCAFVLSLYGFNSLVLTVLYLWHRRDSAAGRAMESAPTDGAPGSRAFRSAQGRASNTAGRAFHSAREASREWPHVTVQLPIYNELHTVERLLVAAAALDYPRERLEIQVLDDSTDDTHALAARCIEGLRSQGVDLVHITRSDRHGYKAGALAAGLAPAKGALLAVFDADFIPNPSFLKRVVPEMDDPRVGCVQTRWGHTNRAYNAITRVQALMLDGHFVVEQAARSRAGFLISFNGSAGVWRRSCIEDAGGWSGDTLTEDLDLSYRAQLRGWRIAYLPDVVVPAELPVQISAFKRQQARWAQGSIQTALATIGPLLRARQPWTVKLQGLFHLTAYLAHPLMLLGVLLLLPATLLSGVTPAWLTRWAQVVTPWLLIAALGPPLLYAVAQAADGHGWPRRLLALPLLVLAGIGIALNNTWAVLKALLGLRQGFLRTPKYDVHQAGEAWVHTRYALSVDPLVWGELAMAAYALSLVLWRAVPWGLAPWLLLYAAGYLYVAATGLIQAVQRSRWLSRFRAEPGDDAPAKDHQSRSASSKYKA